MRLRASVALVAILLGACAPSRREPAPPRAAGAPSAALVPALLDSLRARNPRLKSVEVLSVASWPRAGGPLALVARATVPGEFHGRYEDELFGVFLVDSTLTRVLRLVDSIPTARWHDYELRLEPVSPDSLYAVGEGATYGDEPLRRGYRCPER